MLMSALKGAPRSFAPSLSTAKPRVTSKLLDAIDALVAAGPQPPIAQATPHPAPLARAKTSPVDSLPILSNARIQPSIAPTTCLVKAASESTVSAVNKEAQNTTGKSVSIWYSYKDYGIRAPVYTKNEEEANELVQMLQPGPIGFDMEWRVIFRRGAQPLEFKTAVIQVCDDKLILVIQISAMEKFPSELKALIEDKTRIKLGVNILNDGRKLFRDYGIFAANMVELGKVALQADKNNPFKRPMVSLAKITEYYCKKPLDKGPVRVSNWEAPLTKDMLDYAGNDAHCALMVYRNLLYMAKEEKVTLDLVACAGHIAPPPPLPTASPAASAEKVIPSANTQAGKEALQAKNEIEEIIATSVPAVVTEEAQSTVPADPAPPKRRVWVRPQHMRAYQFWRAGMSLDTMCKKVSVAGEAAPIKPATVIGYIVGALQTDMELEFDLDALVQLVQQDPSPWSWKQHRDWIAAARIAGRGTAHS